MATAAVVAVAGTVERGTDDEHRFRFRFEQRLLISPFLAIQ